MCEGDPQNTHWGCCKTSAWAQSGIWNTETENSSVEWGTRDAITQLRLSFRVIGVELQRWGELGPWSVTERKWEEREGYRGESGEGLSVDPRALSNPTDFQTQSVLSSSVCLDWQLYGDAVADIWHPQLERVLPWSGGNAAAPGAGRRSGGRGKPGKC